MTTEINQSSIGIIGYGSMGSAIAKAIINSHLLAKQFTLKIYAKDRQKSVQKEPSLFFSESLAALVADCDIIFIAVRPEQVAGVVQESVQSSAQNKPLNQKILVSVAAGVTLDCLRTLTGDAFAAVRVMPNTLVEVGKGIFGLCTGPKVSLEQKSIIVSLLSNIGTVVELEERDMNAFTALAGCGPGFLFHIMDSLSEAGVSVGLSRETSFTIAKSLMSGCGMLAEATGRHPTTLREQGTSPAGMTIAGLNYMDCQGLRGHLIEAVKVAYRKGVALDIQTG